MFHVIGEVISCIFWGTLIGVASTLCIVYLIKKISSIPNWNIALMGIFLFFFLSFQFTAMAVATEAKGYIKKINTLSETINTTEYLVEIENLYPAVSPFLKKIKETVNNNTYTPVAISASITKIINNYLWRRAGWITGIILVAFAFTVLLDSLKKPVPKRHYNNKQQSYRRVAHPRRR